MSNKNKSIMKNIFTSAKILFAAFWILLLAAPISAQEWENMQPMDSLPETAPWRSRDDVLLFSEIRQDPEVPTNNVLYIDDHSDLYRRGSYRYDWRLNTETGTPADEANEVAGITMVFRAKPTTESLNNHPDSSNWWWYVSIRASGPVGYMTEMRAKRNTFELVGCEGHIPLVNGKSVYYDIDTNWHTYRVTVIQRDVKIYLDEDPTPIIDTLVTCVDVGGNQLRIGKQDRGTDYGGLFDYFLILEGAIYPPGEGPAIPEGYIVGSGSPSAVNEVEAHAAMSVYPNPVVEAMSLSFQQEKAGMVTVEVYSLSGQKLLVTLHENVPAGVQRFEINTRSLPAGIYLLSVNGEYTKFIKR
jgi:hypothetical protein